MSLDPDAYWRAALAGDPDLLARRPGVRPAGRHDALAPRVPGLDAILAALVTDPALRAALQAGQPGGAELACELIGLGADHDARHSDFGAAHYNRLYPEVAAAGLEAFEHYLLHGRAEGRRTLGDARRAVSAGGAAADPDRPACLICLPELADGPAARAGLALAREAAADHDVIVAAAAPGDGPEPDGLRACACAVAATVHLEADLDCVLPGLAGRIGPALMVSADSFRLLTFLVARDIRFALCPLEDPGDVRPAYGAVFPALFADLAVFGSKARRTAWRPVFDDLGFDAAADSLVVPQLAPLSGVRAWIAGKRHGGQTGFAAISAALDRRRADRRYFAVGPGLYDVPVIFSAGPHDAAARRAERERIWSLGRQFVWRAPDQARAALAASDNWLHRNIGVVDDAPGPAPGAAPDFALHLHAFYTQGLGEVLDRHAAFRLARRIVVSTDTETKAAEIAGVFADRGLAPEILTAPNRGRDILPFLRLFGPGGRGETDELWVHVHQKVVPGSGGRGEVWRRFLMAALLGEGDALSPALAHIADPGTGLVGAFDPYRTGWLGSRRLLDQVAGRLPGPPPPNPLLFPTGNMFWVRRPVVRAMLDLFGPDYPWPPEPIPDDGTPYHLVERLWPAAAAAAGYRSLFLDRPGLPRV